MDATCYTNRPMLTFDMSRDMPGERLKQLREELNLSLRGAAKLSEGGITHAHISHIETDPAAWSKVSYEKLRALARAYNLPLEKFLSRVNGTPYPAKPNIYTDEVTLESPDLRRSTRPIPEIDLLSAGPGGDGGTIIGYVDIPDSWTGDHLAYRVSGDSMSPNIPENATVIVRKREYASPKNVIVCWTAEEGMLCKYLKERTNNGEYVLTSFNPNYAPIWARSLTVYGPVVEVRTRLEVINGNLS